MTDESEDEPDDRGERIRRLLEEAGERLASLDHDGDDVADGFDDLAERANELVSATPPADLLAAVSPAERSEDREAETIQEAIGRSDREELVSLRKLLTMARMDDAEADEIPAYVEDLRALEDVPRSGAQSGGETDGASPEATSEGADDEAAESASSIDSGEDYGEQVREKLQQGIDEFREGIQRSRETLEADDENGTTEGDGRSRSPSGAGTMFSTVPSRDRGDMRSTTRFSAVRGRRRNDG